MYNNNDIYELIYDKEQCSYTLANKILLDTFGKGIPNRCGNPEMAEYWIGPKDLVIIDKSGSYHIGWSISLRDGTIKYRGCEYGCPWVRLKSKMGA